MPEWTAYGVIAEEHINIRKPPPHILDRTCNPRSIILAYARLLGLRPSDRLPCGNGPLSSCGRQQRALKRKSRGAYFLFLAPRFWKESFRSDDIRVNSSCVGDLCAISVPSMPAMTTYRFRPIQPRNRDTSLPFRPGALSCGEDSYPIGDLYNG